MSGMMGDMGQMMGGGKMTPEEMQNMSKMMGICRHDETNVRPHGAGDEEGAVRVRCSRNGNDASVQSARTRSDHENLAKYYEEAAKEVQAKAADMK